MLGIKDTNKLKIITPLLVEDKNKINMVHLILLAWLQGEKDNVFVHLQFHGVLCVGNEIMKLSPCVDVAGQQDTSLLEWSITSAPHATLDDRLSGPPMKIWAAERMMEVFYKMLKNFFRNIPSINKVTAAKNTFFLDVI